MEKKTPEWFRECRKRLGMTQGQLAEALGIKLNSVYRKERTNGQAAGITDRDVLAIDRLMGEANIEPPV